MRKPVYYLLVALAALCIFCAESLADGDVGSEECRVVQLDVQDLVTIAIENDLANKDNAIVDNFLDASKLSGYITKDCAKCITNEFKNNIDIINQVSCGTDPPVCGDDYLDPGEQCDDGNNDAGDGCDEICTIENVDTDGDGWNDDVDCDDDNPDIHPNAGFNYNDIDPGYGFDWNCDGYTEKTVYNRYDINYIPKEYCSGLIRTTHDYDVVDCGVYGWIYEVSLMHWSNSYNECYPGPPNSIIYMSYFVGCR